jgi:hypothetical protein
LYDLSIEESDLDEKNAGVNVYNDSDDRGEKHSENSASGGGVKVLGEKTGYVDNFQHNSLDSEMVPVSVDVLSEEFRDLLQTN